LQFRAVDHHTTTKEKRKEIEWQQDEQEEKAGAATAFNKTDVFLGEMNALTGLQDRLHS